ncbi:MAG: hypothetical protein J2O48_05340 [Solirubrobacterales bacterium]|nr:hypothetical protein [Solirubrobacterales bacterium]
MRRIATTLIAVLALSTALGLSACGGSKLHKAESAGWCALSAVNAYHSFKAHHKGWGAFNSLMAAHNCGNLIHNFKKF